MKGDGNATAPYCLRCRRPLRHQPGGKDTPADTVSPRTTVVGGTQEFTHDGCGGVVVHSERKAKA